MLDEREVFELELRECEPRTNLAEGDDMAARDNTTHPVQPPNRISFAALCLNNIHCYLRQHNSKQMTDIIIFTLDLYRFEALAPMECCTAATGS